MRNMECVEREDEPRPGKRVEVKPGDGGERGRGQRGV